MSEHSHKDSSKTNPFWKSPGMDQGPHHVISAGESLNGRNGSLLVRNSGLATTKAGSFSHRCLSFAHPTGTAEIDVVQVVFNVPRNLNIYLLFHRDVDPERLKLKRTWQAIVSGPCKNPRYAAVMEGEGTLGRGHGNGGRGLRRQRSLEWRERRGYGPSAQSSSDDEENSRHAVGATSVSSAGRGARSPGQVLASLLAQQYGSE
ncbi:hypothetical protein WN48_10116 [Eufriesea mexicana]|nr:hypothetical protein WN48_10116 [Eufriesea mexicana]